MLIKDLPEPIRKLAICRIKEQVAEEKERNLLISKYSIDCCINFYETKEGFKFWDSIRNGNFTPYYAMYGLPKKWCIKCLPEWAQNMKIVNKDWERCTKSMFESNNGLSFNYYYHNHTSGAISRVLDGVTEITLADWLAANPNKKEEIRLATSADVEASQFDQINKPKHYNSHPSGIECIEITQHHDFCTGNAIKYLWRQGLKDGENSVNDLKKAVWYIERKIKQIENSK